MNLATLKANLLAIKYVLHTEIFVTEFQLMKFPNLKVVNNDRFRELQSRRSMCDIRNTLAINNFFVIFDYLNKSALH